MLKIILSEIPEFENQKEVELSSYLDALITASKDSRTAEILQIFRAAAYYEERNNE